MIVSIGRNEKGQDSLRGILKKASESSTSAAGSIKCTVPNIHSEHFGNTWAAFLSSHAFLFTNMFVTKHTKTDNHSISVEPKHNFCSTKT